MKPIKLKMYGFMTYKKLTEIDFTKLYDSKIFVISGDTGSGKTSIFDAISFALFGEISRDGVNQTNLRSDFLSIEDDPTFVDFSFNINGKIYRIVRKPLQNAKKSKKAGVRIAHELEFYQIKDAKEELLADKVTDGDKLIKEIIGLDISQLKKVMLLAQGQFSEFLKANSDEKTKLLSDVFLTQKYGEIQDKLKDESKKLKTNLDNLKDNFKDELKRDMDFYNSLEKIDVDGLNFPKIEDEIKKQVSDKEKLLNEENKNNDLLTAKRDKILLDISNAKDENEKILQFKKINSEKIELEKNEESYIDLKKNLKLAKDAEAIRPYFEAFKANKDEISSVKEKLDNLGTSILKEEKNFEILEKKNKEITEINSEIDEIKMDLNKKNDHLNESKNFGELERKYKKSLEKRENFDKIKELLDGKNVDLSKKTSKILVISNEIREKSEKISEIREEIYKAQKNISTLKSELENVKENENVLENISNIKLSLDILEKEKETNKKELEEALKNEYSLKRNEFIDELNLNGICPVCGSIHQEKIAKLEIVNFDIEKIRANEIKLTGDISGKNSEMISLQKSLKTDLRDKNDLISSLNELEKNLTNLEKDKNNLENHLNKSLDVEKELKLSQRNLENDIEKNKQDLDDLKINLDEFENLKFEYESQKKKFEGFDREEFENQIKKLEEDLNFKNSYIEKTREEFQKVQNDLTRLSSSKKNQEENLLKLENDKDSKEKELREKIDQSFKDQEVFLNALSSYKSLIKLEDEIEKFFDDINDLRIKADFLSNYENKEVVDLKNLDEERESLEEKIENLKTKISEFEISITKLKEMNLKINDIQKEIKSKDKNFNLINRLSKIADGSIGEVRGREKLDFETFVLIYYFERILLYANKRLEKLSNGQYRMVRKKQATQKKSKSGLDIEILDSNTGKLRPASTLSGGESFLASLSLALGLSDEISAENGGIKLDTLFIDEGFGSLSTAYLENAISSIEELSYENKFIGLISHVKEVKDAIDAKILVTYDESEGSEVELII